MKTQIAARTHNHTGLFCYDVVEMVHENLFQQKGEADSISKTSLYDCKELTLCKILSGVVMNRILASAPYSSDLFGRKTEVNPSQISLYLGTIWTGNKLHCCAVVRLAAIMLNN